MYNQNRGRRSGGRNMDGYQGRGADNMDLGIQDRPTSGYHGIQDGPASGSIGPLRTEHLQLHALDLELALLKRKRELIERQQNLDQLINETSYDRPSQFDYNESGRSLRQPGYNEPRSAPARNVGRFYEPQQRNDRSQERFNRPQQSFNRPQERFNRPQERNNRPANKRPASNWPQSAPTRLEAPRSKKPRAQRTTAAVEPPATPRAPRPPVSTTTSSSPKARNFNPTKVTKPTRAPAPAPNKLNTYPVNQRKVLVSQASQLAKNPDEYLLRENDTVSKKLLGRLEIALGAYLKELRAEHESGPYADVFHSHFKLRALKQSLRERIRTAMLGKHVGFTQEVMASVREKFPKEEDLELIKIASSILPLDAKLANLPLDEVDPEKYIEKHFDMLLGRKLGEIFAKIQKLYANDADLVKPPNQVIDNLLLELGHNMNTNQEVVNGDGPSNTTDDITKDVDEATTDVEGGKTETVDTPNKSTDTPYQETTEEEKGNDAKPFDVDANNAEPTAVEAKCAEPTEVIDEDAKKAEPAAVEAKCAKPTEVIDEDAKKAEPAAVKAECPVDQPAGFYVTLVDTLLKRRLPSILPKYKQQLIKILRSDIGYTKGKANILQQAQKKAEAKNGQADKPKEQTATAGSKTQPKKIFPFLVKIMGRPGLPKRELMQGFLDNYHPACIKKHRGIHNLLFVALNTQEDFDNILAANQTVIGKSCLDIRMGSKGGIVAGAAGGATKNTDEATQGNSNTDAEGPKSETSMDQSSDNQDASIEKVEEDTNGVQEEAEDQAPQQNVAENVEDAEKIQEDVKPSQEMAVDDVTEEQA